MPPLYIRAILAYEIAFEIELKSALASAHVADSSPVKVLVR